MTHDPPVPVNSGEGGISMFLCPSLLVSSERAPPVVGLNPLVRSTELMMTWPEAPDPRLPSTFPTRRLYAPSWI